MKKFLHDLFVSNFRNKATALIFAVIIWFYVNSQISIEQRRDLQVIGVPRGAAAGRVNVEVNPDRVTAHVRGPQSALNKYLFHRKVDVRIDVEVPEARDNEFKRELTRKMLILPPEIKVLKFEPEYVAVKVTHKLKKRMEVEANIIGSPASGYRIKAVTVLPNKVDVTGPHHSVKSTRAISTVPVEVSGRDRTFSELFACEMLIDNSAVTVEPSKVTVTVEIEERPSIGEFILPVRIVLPSDYPYDIRLENQTRKVVLKGPAAALGEIRPGDYYLVVRLAERPNLGGLDNRGPAELMGPRASSAIRLAEEVFVKYKAFEKEKGNSPDE